MVDSTIFQIFLWTFLGAFLLSYAAIVEPTPEEMLKRHQTFQDLYFRQNEENFVRLVKEGQAPRTLFIGCSDSRVIPELITMSKPGDLFVIRSAGNFVPVYSESQDNTGIVGTIEFALHGIGVEDIIVCGHSHCGAIAGVINGVDDTKFASLKRWLKNGDAAKAMTQNVPEVNRQQQTEKTSVIFQLKHLLSYPFIKEKVEKNELRLHGWYFDIETGQIYYYDREKYQFVKL